jgi:hypothetical protein
LVYLALVGLAASKYVFFHLNELVFFAEITWWGYWEAMGATMTTAVLKTTLIVAYFQHLRWEPRSLTNLMLMSVALVILLMAAASFSIT